MEDDELLKYEGCSGSSVARSLASQPMSSTTKLRGVELKEVRNGQYNFSFDPDIFERLAERGMSFRVRCCESDPGESVYMYVFLDGEYLWHEVEPDYWGVHRALEGADEYMGLDNDKVLLVWRSRSWFCFSRRGVGEFDVSCGAFGVDFRPTSVPEEVCAAVGRGTHIGRISCDDDGAELGEMFCASGVVTGADIEGLMEYEDP